jgi:hypothetical protein
MASRSETLASLLKNTFNTPLSLRNLPCGVETGITSGCSKRPSSKAAGESKPEACHFSPAHPKLPRQLVFRVGYVENFDEPRTLLGKRHVLARRGWAGEKGDVFSILFTQGVRTWLR